MPYALRQPDQPTDDVQFDEDDFDDDFNDDFADTEAEPVETPIDPDFEFEPPQPTP